MMASRCGLMIVSLRMKAPRLRLLIHVLDVWLGAIVSRLRAVVCNSYVNALARPDEARTVKIPKRKMSELDDTTAFAYFGAMADSYDSLIRRAVPRYDEMTAR